MLISQEDAVTRAAIRLKRVAEGGRKDAKSIVDRFNLSILEEMNVTLSMVINAINELFKCESLRATEKYLALETFHDLLVELMERKEDFDLGELPSTLSRMKFLRNEKYVERAVVVYLKVYMLVLQAVNTMEQRINLFKVFCTLFMTKAFITSSKCGYLLPSLFRSFLSTNPEFIENLLDNGDRLILCPSLLETVLSSHPKMDTRISRLIVVDYLKRRTNTIILSCAGKGHLSPFYFQIYMENETEPLSEIVPIFIQKDFLEYLFLDVSIRLTSKNILVSVIRKILEVSPVFFIRMIRTDKEEKECIYCSRMETIEEYKNMKKDLEKSLETFNIEGSIEEMLETLKKYRIQNVETVAANYLRAHPNTNLCTLGKYLGKDSHKNFLETFCNTFTFSEHSVLSALRAFLMSFNLPGEGEVIDRIIHAFCTKYAEEKKENIDTVLSIAMSIIILNTSMHNENLMKKITIEEFVGIIKAECPSIQDTYLESIYEQIKEEKLHIALTNRSSLDKMEFALLQEEADKNLHKEIIPEHMETCCSTCSRKIYLYLLQLFSVSDLIVEEGKPQGIKEFIKTCMKIGVPEIAHKTIYTIKDPQLALKLIYDYKEHIASLWKAFLAMAVKEEAAEEEITTGAKIFRGLFMFGRETKKEKKDVLTDLEIEDLMQVTQTLSDERLTEIATDLYSELEKEKKKTLYRIAYLMLLKNKERIHLLTPLMELLLCYESCSADKLTLLCTKENIKEFLFLLENLSYKQERSMRTGIGAFLEKIERIFKETPTLEEELFHIKRCLLSILGSSLLRTKDQGGSHAILRQIESLSLLIDASGYDSFEIFIKIREVLQEESKKIIIANTKAYYKSINRMVLCLNILQDPHSREVDDAFLSLLSMLLEKDQQGIVSMLSGCETILEKISIREEVEKLIYENTKNSEHPDQKYLQQLFKKMQIPQDSSNSNASQKDVVDL
ncbi:hypothetical protein NEFER03_1214 [Nematocida sp. LUAm3]|nr:hypothetical protein NEFER03_1214 [Nematocida sp. LUAm3]KAI5175823.1 hypothetical protein NEFER02_1692 [Nematocida sp. LUAm2]KAI5178319.1 hypothetical protein NEFER01_1486 [Nematocida sp. LUAm1]